MKTVNKVKQYGFRRGLKRNFLFSVFLLAFQETLAIIYPLFLKNTTDLIKNNTKTPSLIDLIVSGGIVLLFIAVILVVNIFTEYNLSSYASGVQKNVRKALFEKMQRVPSDKISEYGAGKVLATMMNDSTWIKTVDRRLVTLMVYLPITILGSFIILLVLNWVYFLIAIAALPIILLIFYFNSKVLNPIMHNAADAYDSFFRETRESIAGARDIRILGKADERSEDAMVNAEIHRAQTRSADKSIYFSQGVNALLFSVITAAIILYGAMYSIDDAMKLVILSTAIQYVNAIWTGLNNMYKWFIDNNTRGRVAYKRIWEFLDLPEEDKDSGVKCLPETASPVLQFENVGFSFWNGRKMLENFSLKLSDGKLIAIAGPSGGGKTMVTKLLLRYVKASKGQITINGLEIGEINKRFYRKDLISHCSSHSNFVPGTVRDNIKLFNPNVTDAEILNVFCEIGANKIASTRNFLDMQISNRARYAKDVKNIVNIVRAILKPAQFYFFNRCFSDINPDITEGVIRRLRKDGKTCLFLTFNGTVCKNVDEIYFVEGGTTSAIGEHKALLYQSEHYASFFADTVLFDSKNEKPTVQINADTVVVGAV